MKLQAMMLPVHMEKLPAQQLPEATLQTLQVVWPPWVKLRVVKLPEVPSFQLEKLPAQQLPDATLQVVWPP